MTSAGMQRSKTCLGLAVGKKHESFYLPPDRSFSADHWLSPTPEVRGRLGAFFDFMSTLYVEVPVLAPLVARLVSLLGLGVRAYSMLFRLTMFAIALSPAISKIGYWWWRSPTIVRSVCYGRNPRNFLDIYLPSSPGPPCPVIIYITGGAWIIGYKAWAAPLGEFWSRHNIITVSVDYRNFPQGTFADMVTDVETAIQWIVDNVGLFGGDPEKITLVGQSAGAHIASFVMLNRHKSKVGSWTVEKDIKNFVGVSGPYDIVSIAPILNKRGLYTNVLKSVMNDNFFNVSPSRIVVPLLNFPPILLLHGTADLSVPFDSSVKFHETLVNNGYIDTTLELWQNIGHSDPIVEGPAEGRNYLPMRITQICYPEEPPKIHSKPIMNSFMVRIAKFFMPF